MLPEDLRGYVKKKKQRDKEASLLGYLGPKPTVQMNQFAHALAPLERALTLISTSYVCAVSYLGKTYRKLDKFKRVHAVKKNSS